MMSPLRKKKVRIMLDPKNAKFLRRENANKAAKGIGGGAKRALESLH